jgi:ATP-binding cassette, subfamily F, member 3
MISFLSVSLQRGLKVILSDVDFCFYPGQKVGLVGRNGTGKTTLFSMIVGDLAPDSGAIDIPASMRISYVEQEVRDARLNVVSYVKAGDPGLFAVESEIASLEGSHCIEDLTKLSLLYEEFEALGGYQFSSKVEKLLFGLGFSASQMASRVSGLSGGWQMRLNLAKALVCDSDILLLDEPTNHLDVEAVLWLEKWIKSYSGMVLMVSHDRVFLDNTVDYIAHLDSLKVMVFTGNFSAFERQRSETILLQKKTYDKQQKTIEHLESFVKRFKAKASKAKQAQSRVKMLEKIQVVDLVKGEKSIDFHFLETQALGGPLLSLRGVSCGYSIDFPVISDVSFSIMSGMRIGLLGVNGAGKSTLIKTLVGDINTLEGELTRHGSLSIGYFEQHTIDQLDFLLTPMEHFQNAFPKVSDSELRSFLGSFGFSNEMALTNVGCFSGGEKARLSLAIIVFNRPNLLLLDEPTNHLDIYMRQSLTIAMQEYVGAVIIVSHDRFLLGSTVDSYYLLSKGKLSAFDGDLGDYQKYLLASESSGEKCKKKNLSKHGVLAQKKEQQLLKKSVDRLEREVAKCSSDVEKLASQIEAESSTMVGGAELSVLIKKYTSLKEKLDQLELEWMDALDLYESSGFS